MAYSRGYRISDAGEAFSPKGDKLNPCFGNTGYLRFSLKVSGEPVQHIPVHRLSAFQKFGYKIFNKGLEVRHLDNNKGNNKKANISIGTPHQNAMDIPKEARLQKSLVAARKRRKFSPSELLIFLKDRERGYSLKDLSLKYGIAKSTASYIVNGKTYKIL